MKQPLFLQFALLVIIVPVLACGSRVTAVSPTPTKTPRILRTVEPLQSAQPTAINLPTHTSVPIEELTDTPVPSTDTPTPEPVPTDTPTPEPIPTDTPLPPPPPPTDTPPPPPPANTPAPPPPSQPPANTGPQVSIDLPGGDTYGVDDEVKVIITVRDPDGVNRFTWGIFAQNESPTGLGDDKDCGNAVECRIDEEFDTKFKGQFFIGVDAVDSKGNKVREIKELYVG